MKERVFIKGFDKDLKCRGYQFEIGKEYKIDLPEDYELTDKDLCTDYLRYTNIILAQMKVIVIA